MESSAILTALHGLVAIRNKKYTLRSAALVYLTSGNNHKIDYSINSDTIRVMVKVLEILKLMRNNPKGIRFNDLCKVCDKYFGEPRQSGSSHRVYKTPWQGDPRVNIQNSKGKAKPYQIQQVLQAIDRLEVEND